MKIPKITIDVRKIKFVLKAIAILRVDNSHLKYGLKKLKGMKLALEATENVIDTYKPDSKSAAVHDKAFNVLSRFEEELEEIKASNIKLSETRDIINCTDYSATKYKKIKDLFKDG